MRVGVCGTWLEIFNLSALTQDTQIQLLCASNKTSGRRRQVSSRCHLHCDLQT